MTIIASRIGAALTAAGLFIAVSPVVSALDIALTNDEGWDTIGIQAVKKALVLGGHTVTLVGTVDDESARSASLDLSRPSKAEISLQDLVITKKRDDDGALEYSVALEGTGGTESAAPATIALLAIDIARERGNRLPDLLVSGINDEANLGAVLQISSTVGASIVALGSTFNGSVPAIAISTDPICSGDTDDCATRTEAHYARVADFLVSLIDHLHTKPGILRKEAGLLPLGIGLNVNYPPVEVPNGVVVVRQGRTASLGGPPVTLTIGCEESCKNLGIGASTSGELTFVPDLTLERRDSDTEAFAQGYITITPIAADYTNDGYKQYESVFRTLRF